MRKVVSSDAAAVGPDRSVPSKRLAATTAPTLIMNGGTSQPFMYETALALSTGIPGAQLRTLGGQDHAADPRILAPLLIDFFVRGAVK